jgi:hypothetical protein
MNKKLKQKQAMSQQLYDRDFNLWAEEQASALRARQFSSLDYDRLIEEIEDMSKSEKRSLETYLERLIEHILKLKYWKSEYKYNCRHWQAEVNNFRNRIQRLLKRSPSLNSYLANIYQDIYQDALESCSLEFDIKNDKLIPLEKMLDKSFFGDEHK